MHEILSLGAGVQSTTVYHRSGIGDLPKLDMAIFADTGWEPKAVYQHLRELIEVYAPKYGIPIQIVKQGDLRKDAINSKLRAEEYKKQGGRWAALPLRTVQKDGSKGMIKRQCTAEYKITPIERFIKESVLELDRKARYPKEHCVRQWFGISVDEFSRMRKPTNRRKVKKVIGHDLFGKEITEEKTVHSPILWKSNYYPLIGVELFGDKKRQQTSEQPWTRQDCLDWMARNGFPTPPRSACIGCPYRSNVEWREIRKNSDEWQDAIEFDEAIRDSGGIRGKMYLHRDCVPLYEANIDEDDGGRLFGDECEGLCGV